MRPKKISIGDLRDRVEVYRITTTGRTATGGIVANLEQIKTAFVNIQSKMKRRETGEGSIQYYREYNIIARPGAFEQGDQLWFNSQKISVDSISDANTGMIEATGLSVTA